MAKANWNEYSATPGSNTVINDINIDEACPASSINNAIREVMAHTADVVAGTVALSTINIDGGAIDGAVVGANAAAAGTFTTGTFTTSIELDVATGDPKIVFDTQGADKFVVGVDDDDSDILKIDTGATVGSSTALEIASDKTLFAQHQIVKINAQTGTTYTTVLTDANKLVTLNNGSAIALTIPTNSSVAYPIGTIIGFQTLGSGQDTTGGSGVTFRNRNGLLSAGQYACWALTKIDTDTWAVAGDLES